MQIHMYARLSDIASSLRVVFGEKRNAATFAVITVLMFMLYVYLLSYSSIALFPGPTIFGLSVAVITVSFLLSAM